MKCRALLLSLACYETRLRRLGVEPGLAVKDYAHEQHRQENHETAIRGAAKRHLEQPVYQQVQIDRENPDSKEEGLLAWRATYRPQSVSHDNEIHDDNEQKSQDSVVI